MKEVPDEPFPRANNVVGVGIVVYLPRFLKAKSFSMRPALLIASRKNRCGGSRMARGHRIG